MVFECNKLFIAIQYVVAGQDWTLMKNISVTEYLNFEGTHFSKSRGVGVFGNDAKQTGIPVEVRQSAEKKRKGKINAVRCG